MNSSKRKRHTLYFWIDVFFLSFPLVLVVGYISYFFISYSLASKELFTSFWNSTDSFDNIYSYLYGSVVESMFSSPYEDDGWFSLAFDNIISFIFSWSDSDDFNFVKVVRDFLSNVFYFLGLNQNTIFSGYYNFFGLVFNYIIYMICYEFLSFFIQIVLWIPRYFKNKLYDRGLME